MKRALAAAMLIAACTSSPTRPAISPSPSPSPSAVMFPSPQPSPSPQPLQRAERSLPAPIEETAAAAAGGKLYVIGGFNAAGASLPTVYVFDGSRWTAGPRLPLGLDHPSAATLNDEVYVAGGHSNGVDSARLLRLDGSRWTELARMHFARGGHALIALNGRLWAVGGNTSQGNVGPVESYNPATNAWRVVASLPQPRNHVMGFVVGSQVCVAGGRSPTTARIDCLDTVRLRWGRLQNLPKASSGGGAVTFPSGDVVLAGGQDASETFIVNQLVYYSAAAGWFPARTMLVPRHGFQLALFDGRAWACGGGTAPGLHPVATCTSLGDPAASKS